MSRWVGMGKSIVMAEPLMIGKLIVIAKPLVIVKQMLLPFMVVASLGLSTANATSLESESVMATKPETNKKAANSNDQSQDLWGDDGWGNDDLGNDDLGDDKWSNPWDEPKGFWQSFNGFAELALGQRLQNDPLQPTATLQDLRIQLQNTYTLSSSTINFRGQLYFDGIQDKWQSQIRELNWQGKVSEQWDIKAGQQVITWGTGDYLFVNDLFAKDWQSFFSGRDDEYLKAPQLALKASGYFSNGNVDIVITPSFTSDEYIDGSVFSYFNPLQEMPVVALEINKPSAPEYAIRFKTNVGQSELALYGYHGFEKSPQSLAVNFSKMTGQPVFQKLSVVGGSVTAPIWGGIASAEIGHYNRIFDNPNVSDLLTIPNYDESKLLIGFDRELIQNLTAGVQYLYEYSHKSESEGLINQDTSKRRSLVTLSLMYQALQNKLNVHWFSFISPSDEDGYHRLKAIYKPNDQWQYSIGANYFWGQKPTSFFGQFEDGSNAYFSIRRFF